MTRTARRNIDSLPYSLHDMSVTAMERAGAGLTLRFADGFVRVGAPPARVPGHIEFLGVDWDHCHAYVMGICANTGRFEGEKLALADFAERFGGKRFDIVDETYGYNKSRFAGYLRHGNALSECVIEIYHAGGMVYVEQPSCASACQGC